MEAKKRKLINDAAYFECCVCGESGSNGFTNIYNISLREKDDFSISFVDVVNFVLDIEVHKESSEICISCKPKIIEFYHFKKRSQALRKKNSPLIQEIMKIVNNFVSKNEIKAITIEESREKLIIMEKIELDSTSQEINDIKREPEEVDEQQFTLFPNTDNQEEEVIIKQETLDINENPYCTNEQKSIAPSDTVNSESKLDQILKINLDIFNMISFLNKKFEENG